MPTPEELRTWRAAAVASGNAEDVAHIDAELGRVQPLGDLTPLEDAYRDKRHAMAEGAPPDVIQAIDSHIQNFTRSMREADVNKTLEGMGAGGQFLAGAGRGLTNVWEHAKDVGHEALDAVQRSQPTYLGQLPLKGPLPGQTDREVARAAERQQFNQETAPLTQSFSGEMGNMVGEAAGTAPLALATGGAGPIIGSTLAGAGTGALLSDPGERLQGAAIGGGTGLLLGGLGSLGSKPIEGIVKPSAAAQKLQAMGVEGITAGQAAPRSAVAHFEQAAESTPLGASVKAAREELPLNLEQRIIKEAAPPGFTPTLGRETSVPERLQELRQAFSDRYNALYGDKSPVPKDYIQHKVFNQAMNPAGRVLVPADKKAAADFVAGELSKLDQNNSLETLANIRSNVGDRARSLQRSNPELSSHLRDVKTSLTGEIEDALRAHPDPDAFPKLQALDKAYSRFKTVMGAAAYDPAGATTITPDRLSRSILQGTTRDQFAQGAGGDLRELARAGKQVLSPPRPTTGALTGVLHALPFVGPWATGVAGYASSHFPQAMMGQTLPQRILQRTLMQPVVASELGQMARSGSMDAANAILHPGQSSETDGSALPTEEAPLAHALPLTLKRKKKHAP